MWSYLTHFYLQTSHEVYLQPVKEVFFSKIENALCCSQKKAELSAEAKKGWSLVLGLPKCAALVDTASLIVFGWMLMWTRFLMFGWTELWLFVFRMWRLRRKEPDTHWPSTTARWTWLEASTSQQRTLNLQLSSGSKVNQTITV